jgi:muramidase (phage lysozyme)
MLNSTWLEKVKQYRSKQSNLTRNSDNFEPQSQDEVVYAWLKDRHV